MKEIEELNNPLCSSVRAAIAQYHRLGGLNNRNLFSHISGGCKSRASSVGFCWDLSLWIVDTCLLSVSSHGLFSVSVWKEDCGVCSSSYEDTSPVE